MFWTRAFTGLCLAFVFLATMGASAVADDPWLVFEGGAGPGHGKHIVFVSGDEEYRSEEGLPQLAKILAQRHGFKCTVLFSIDPHDGTINPNQHDNIPGLEALRTADLMVILTRFRELPDEQMRYVVDYVESGRPIVGLRTATHAFAPKPGTTFARYGWQSKEWDGGFGRQVLGETWIAPPRPSRPAEHARDHRTRDAGAPDSARHQRRRHLGSDRRLCRAAAATGNLPATGVGPSPLRNAPERSAGGRQAERPDDAGGLDQAFRRPSGKKARVFATTMGASRIAERRPPPLARQRVLLGRRYGRPNPAEIGRRPCRPLRADSVWL